MIIDLGTIFIGIIVMIMTIYFIYWFIDRL